MSLIDAFNRRRERLDPATLAETIRQIDGRAFTYDTTPFLRYPTACLGDIGGTCRVIIQSPAQVGKTVTIENFLAWVCEYDRQNALLILDSDKTGKRMSKNRLRPFLRDTCGINTKESRALNPDASKEISNIGLAPGANLIIGSSKSASDLCSTPVKYLLCDELDRWADSLEREGDPLALAFQRQMRFPSSMALLTSTPTVEDGRIHQQYMLGTQERWGVICECGKWFDVPWSAIDWTGNEPLIACPHCGTFHTENEIKSLVHAYSEPQNASAYRDKCGRIAHSFAITATLCHAFYTWDYLKREEQTARALGEVNYQSFQNTRLGEVYIPSDERIIFGSDVMRVSCVNYDTSNLPSDIHFIVAGVDTQDSGFAVEICGFSTDRSRVYGIDWVWVAGSPKHDPSVWQRLHETLSRTFHTEDGRNLRVSVTCHDSGGHCTQEVYAFTFRRKGHFAVKGTMEGKELIPRVSHVTLKTLGTGTGRVLLISVGTVRGKDMIQDALTANLNGDKQYLWPRNGSYDADYFEQLTAEKRIVERGGKVRWVCLPGRHNEGLDCRVYALVAAEIVAQKACITAPIRDIHEAHTEKDIEKPAIKREITETNHLQASNPINKETEHPSKPAEIHKKVSKKARFNSL